MRFPRPLWRIEPPSLFLPTPTFSFLALHGFTGSGNDFQDLAQRSRAWSQWKRPDLPGHGNPPVASGIPLFEQCRQEVVDSWSSLNPSHIRVGLGYSLGGRLWLQLLPDPDLPCEALVLIGSHPGLVQEKDREDRRIRDLRWIEILETEGTEAFLQKWKAQPLLQSQSTRIRPEVWNLMQQSAQGLEPKTLVEFFRQLSPGVLPPRQHFEDLGALPILWVAGEEDPKYAHLYRELAEKYSPWQSLILPNAGHAAHLEAPEAFLHGLKSFLENTFSQP